MLRANALK